MRKLRNYISHKEVCLFIYSFSMLTCFTLKSKKIFELFCKCVVHTSERAIGKYCIHLKTSKKSVVRDEKGRQWPRDRMLIKTRFWQHTYSFSQDKRERERDLAYIINAINIWETCLQTAQG